MKKKNPCEGSSFDAYLKEELKDPKFKALFEKEKAKLEKKLKKR